MQFEKGAFRKWSRHDYLIPLTKFFSKRPVISNFSGIVLVDGKQLMRFQSENVVFKLSSDILWPYPPALAKVLLATSLVSQQTDEWRMVTTHTFYCTWRIIPYKAIYLSDEWFYNSTIKATQDISLTGFGFLRTRKFLPVRSLGAVWDIELSRQLS